MNKFDQNIKNKLSQPQLPPLEAWKNIQEKLDEKEKKRRIIPIFYWIGSTAACLVAGISVYYFNQNGTRGITPIPTNEIVKTKSTSNQELSNYSNKIEKVKAQSSLNSSISSIVEDEGKKEKKIKNSILYFDELIEESPLFSKTNIDQNESFQQKLDSNSLNQKNNSTIKKSISQKNDILEEEILVNNQDEKRLELVLEEEKKKINEKIVEKKKSPILAVSSYINPTKMLESKSILADEFNDHNIKNNITVAYGAKVSVRLNDKLNIRSGIAKVELEQNTTNINSGINTGVNALSANTPKSSSNISYHSNIRVVGNNASLNATMTMLSSEANTMEQKVHYIEVPLEVEYKLASFDKFNILATAGGSYYVVTKNSISLADTNTRSNYKLGEADNLNNSSYSANAGVKLEYNLSNKSSVNLEPNYKYMLNPLKNVDAKNPSLLGLNLGFSIKF